MIQIRPVSDLRYKFPEIESLVQESGPLYLTKNGHGSMVIMNLETFERLTNPLERALDEADRQAQQSQTSLTHEEVFGKLREKFDE